MIDIDKDVDLGLHVTVGVTHVTRALNLLVQAGLLRPRYLGVSSTGCFVHGLLRVLFCVLPKTVTVALKLKTRLEAKSDFQLPRDAAWMANRVLPSGGELLTRIRQQLLASMAIRVLLFIVPGALAVMAWLLFRNP